MKSLAKLVLCAGFALITSGSSGYGDDITGQLPSFFKQHFESCWHLPQDRDTNDWYLVPVVLTLNEDGAIVSLEYPETRPDDIFWEMQSFVNNSLSRCYQVDIPGEFRESYELWRRITIYFRIKK